MRRFKMSRGGKVIPSEHEEQSALMRWAELAAHQEPDLGLLFAIPNGGHRHPSVAAALKREGVKSGVPDLFLPVVRAPFPGLFIELKAQSGTLSPTQKRWGDLLRAQGYAYAVAFGWEEAKDVLEGYLKGEHA